MSQMRRASGEPLTAPVVIHTGAGPTDAATQPFDPMSCPGLKQTCLAISLRDAGSAIQYEVARAALYDFVKGEYSPENLEFAGLCEAIAAAQPEAAKAGLIAAHFGHYLGSGAATPVNLNADLLTLLLKTHADVLNAMRDDAPQGALEAAIATFEPALKDARIEIVDLINRDSFGRFKTACAKDRRFHVPVEEVSKKPSPLERARRFLVKEKGAVQLQSPDPSWRPRNVPDVECKFDARGNVVLPPN